MLEKTKKGVTGWWRFPKSWVTDGFLSEENSIPFRLLIFIVSSVNFSESFYFGEKLRPGEMVYTWAMAQSALGVSKQNVRTAEKLLVNLGYIEKIEVKNKRFSIVRIVDFCFFQGNQQPPIPTTQTQAVDLPVMIKQEPETQIEKKKEKKTKKEKIPFQEWQVHIEAIIDYLNKETKSNRGYDSVLSRELIARWLKSGYHIYDFFAVILYKSDEWGKKPEMVDYLRPQTLFSAKHFQGYLEDAYNSKTNGINRESNEYKDWFDLVTLIESQEKWLKSIEGKNLSAQEIERKEVAEKLIEENKNLSHNDFPG